MAAMNTHGLYGLLILTIWLSPVSMEGQITEKTHIIYILADDLGYGGPAPFSGKGWQEVDDIDFTRDILDGPNQHGFDEAIVSPGCPSDDIFNFWVENNKIPSELETRGASGRSDGNMRRWIPF